MKTKKNSIRKILSLFVICMFFIQTISIMAVCAVETTLLGATELDPSEILYQNDFTDSQFRLTNVSSYAGSIEIVAGPAIRIKDLHTAVNYKENCAYKIEGSEDWQDYELSYTANRTGTYGVGAVMFRMQDSQNNYIATSNYATTSNASYSIAGLWNNSMNQPGMDAIFNQSYTNKSTANVTLRVEGDTASYTIDGVTKTGSLVNTNTNTYYQTGGVAFSALQYGIIYDNILVKDLRATAKVTSAATNLVNGDTVTVQFSRPMDFSTFASGNVVLSDGVNTIVPSITNNGTNELYVTIPDEVSSSTNYTLEVKKEVLDTNGKRLNNNKNFIVSTMASSFEITGVTPVNGATGVGVAEEIAVDFSNTVDNSTLTASNITLTKQDGTPVDYTIDTGKSTATKIYLDPTGYLSYDTIYNLQLKNIKDTSSNIQFGIKKVSFTTETDQSAILYQNNFDNGEVRLTNVSEYTDTTSIVNNAFKIVAADNTWKNNSAYKIDGSDDWQDYELSYTATRTSTYGVGIVMFRMQDPKNNYIALSNYSATPGAFYSIRGLWSNTMNQPGMDEAFGQNYSSKDTANVTLRVEGDTASYTVDGATTTGSLINTNTNTYYQTGGVAFSTLQYGIVYDNILVKDLRATANSYNTKDLKNGDMVTIKFSRPMNASTMTASNVSLVCDGAAYEVTVSNNGTNEMYVTMPEDLEGGKTYTLTAKKEILDANGKRLNNNKTFTVTSLSSNCNAVNTSPVSGSSGVNTFEDVVVTFDNPIDYTALSGITYSLTDSQNNTVECGINSVLSNGNTLYFQIRNELHPLTVYTFKLSGVKALNGDTMLGTKKIVFTTEDKMADYLYENDFSGGTLDGILRVEGDESSIYVEDGVLKIKDNTGSWNEHLTAKIEGSENWYDYEVSYDYIRYTTGVSYPTLLARYTSNTSCYRLLNELNDGYAVRKWTIGSNSGQTERTSAILRNVPVHSVITVLGSTIIYQENGVEMYRATDSSLTTGGIGLKNYFGAVGFDNIKVKDLGISCTASPVKNVDDGGSVVVAFDRDMITDTFIGENVIVKDDDGVTLNTTVTAVDSKDMRINLPKGMESGAIYTITLKSTLTSLSGMNLSSDKYLKFKSSEALAHVANLGVAVISGTTETIQLNLVKNTSITGVADIKNNSTSAQTFTIVLAIYKNDVLVDVKVQTATKQSGESEHIVTEAYALPAEDVTGYSAGAMALETLDNIYPLCKSILITAN